MNSNKKKTFAQRYSKEFEKLILEIVTDTLNTEFKILTSDNTPEKNDGGYDGYCIIQSSDTEKLTTLLEAKLRTSCKDLPLSDFSKSIIIAVNSEAACIVIGTNIYFSGNSIYQLEKFIYNTGLDIRTIDYKDILNWMNNNADKCKVYNKCFINRLRNYAEKNYENASRNLSLLENLNFACNNEKDTEIYGVDRKQIRKQIVYEIRKSPKTFVIFGEKGIGKKTLVNSILFRLKANKGTDRKHIFSINKIDVGQISSHNDFIYMIISALWGCNYADTVDFLNDLTNEENKRLMSNLISSNIFSALTALSNRINNIIDIDVFYSYINSLYCKKSSNIKIHKIFYFYNIEYSNNEVLKNIITFIRKMTGIVSIILCLQEEQPLNMYISEWNVFLNSITESRDMTVYKLKEWKNDDANKFVKDHTTDREISRYSIEIVDYFGKNPACLSAGIELIEKDKLILSQIRYGNFKLDSSFDVNKLKSAFLTINKNLNAIQLRIEYLLLLMESKIEIEFIKKVLCIEEHTLHSEVKNMPLIKCDGFLYWKDRFYADLFNEEEYNYLMPLEEIMLLKNIILNIDLLNSNYYQRNLVLIKVYLKLRNASKAQEISQPFIENLKANEQYTNLYHITCMLTDSNLFNNNSTFSILIRIELLDSALKIGLNGDDTDICSRYIVLKDKIKNYYLIDSEVEQDIKLLIGKFYYISSTFHLTNSEYEKMKKECINGLKYLNNITTQEALYLKSELCANYAVSIKHLSNIEDCVRYLEENETITLQPEIIMMPKYQISYHTHHASLFTGRDPQKALDEFLIIEEICKKYSKEAYLHNLHNISSMQFILKRYDDALLNAQTVYQQAYEYNISVELGRCQNVLGCLMWKDRKMEVAKNYFLCSYTHFKNHRHNTHIWAPLVNLAVLCTEEKDEEAYTYTKDAFEFLTKNHINQIRNAKIEKNNIPKIIVAVLMILRNFNILYGNMNEMQKMIGVISNRQIQELYDHHIKGKSMNQLFDDTPYNCDGIVMLKV